MHPALSKYFYRVLVVMMLSFLMVSRLLDHISSIGSGNFLLDWASIVILLIVWIGSITGVLGHVYSPYFARGLTAVAIIGLFSSFYSIVLFSFYNSSGGILHYLISSQIIHGIVLFALVLVCAHWIGKRKSKMDEITLDLDGSPLERKK
jgi:hypothetical protein